MQQATEFYALNVVRLDKGQGYQASLQAERGGSFRVVVEPTAEAAIAAALRGPIMPPPY